MEEQFAVVIESQWNKNRMDGRRIIKNMLELSKGNHSKHFKKFSRAHDQVYESIWSRIL